VQNHSASLFAGSIPPQVPLEAAGLVRERYGATTVIAFGSLAEGTHFSERSDIDLAAAGLRPGAQYAALGRLLTLSPDFEFDLVDLDACAAELPAHTSRSTIVDSHCR